MKKSIITIILLLITITLITTPIYAQNDNNIKAKVIKDNGVIEKEIDENNNIQQVQNVTIKILDGDFESEEYDMQYILTEDINFSNICRSKLVEKNIILINIQEESGEITNIIYKGIVNQNYELYLMAFICFMAILFIGKKNGIKLTIIYLIIVGLVLYIFIISIIRQLNLILISFIISIIITIFLYLFNKNVNKKSILMILYSVSVMCFTGIIVYVLYDIINIIDPMINIQILNIKINIKEIICSLVILLSSGVCNCISYFCMMNSLMNDEKTKYKTKSENVLDGQRSLKL